MAGGALALRDGALQVDGINRAAYMHCTDGSVMLVLGFAKPVTKREEAAAFLPAVAGQWRGLGPGDHTWETVEGWGTDAKAQRGSRASQKRNRREERKADHPDGQRRREKRRREDYVSEAGRERPYRAQSSTQRGVCRGGCGRTSKSCRQAAKLGRSLCPGISKRWEGQ